MKKLLGTLPLFLMILGCNQAPMSTDGSVLSARTADWEAALDAKDIDALVMTYTSDARLMPPNGEMASGGDAVRTIFGGMLDAGLSADLVSIEAMASGDIGYDVGTYVIKDGDAVVDNGKFIEIFHRGDDGVWRISTDIWNSDVPVAAPMEEDEPMD